MGDELVELQGSRRQTHADANRVGDISADETLTVTVYVRRDPEAQAIVDPAAEAEKHPRDRRYLSAGEVESSFGASVGDLQAVADYAVSKSLKTSDRSRTKRSIKVTGPAGALTAAFGVDLGHFEHGGLAYRGRTGPVRIPASLAGVVEAVLGFDNRPMGRSYLRTPAGGQMKTTLAEAAARGLPANNYYPPQVAALYGFPAQYDGTGETVAVFVFNGDIGSGIKAPGGYRAEILNEYFSKALKMAPPTLTDVVVQGPGNTPGRGTNPYDVSGEVYLDLCIVGSLAPGAKIAVYFTEFTEQGWVDAISQAATDTVNDPSVISISYGNPESDAGSAWTTMAINQVNQAFEVAASAGRTICCAAGDSGAADDTGSKAVHVDFPASSPWVLGCGGTRLESQGGAISSEVVWDDLADHNGATGGGVSAIFAQPAWQAGSKAVCLPGVTSPQNGRGVPDVSSLGDPETPYAIVGPNGALQQVGGTSAAAPLWSALTSRYNQALAARVGFINPMLYSKWSGALRDITSGNNGGYQAEPGWDACTGWGSPGAISLLRAIQGT
jgi:kumamolisin